MLGRVRCVGLSTSFWPHQLGCIVKILVMGLKRPLSSVMEQFPLNPVFGAFLDVLVYQVWNYRYTAINPYLASVNGQPANVKEQRVLFRHRKIIFYGGGLEDIVHYFHHIIFRDIIHYLSLTPNKFSLYFTTLDECNRRRSRPWKRRTTYCWIIVTNNSMLAPRKMPFEFALMPKCKNHEDILCVSLYILQILIWLNFAAGAKFIGKNVEVWGQNWSGFRYGGPFKPNLPPKRY